MTDILEGIKVVSMGQMVATPAATSWLSDMGADVIKIEPLAGETFRGATRAQGTTTMTKISGVDVKYGFQLVNRGKKSLALDLKKEAGRDIVYKLVKGADVFTSNYMAESLSKLKLDYATLSEINPRLIYAFLSGFGVEGPDKNMGGYDWVASWARSGMQYLISEPGRAPAEQRPGQGDTVGAAHSVVGILAALLHREKTGKGQEVESSLYQSAVWTLSFDTQGALAGTPRTNRDRTKAQNPISNRYRTKDDRWLSLGMFLADAYWANFCKSIERPELENDPRFNNMRVRGENSEELVCILDEVFATRTADEWDAAWKGYGFIYARAQSPEEVISDPQALANDFFVELHHPAGPMKTVASPVTFRQNPASVKAAAPELGQNNEEILLELGYDWSDIAQLKEEQVIL